MYPSIQAKLLTLNNIVTHHNLITSSKQLTRKRRKLKQSIRSNLKQNRSNYCQLKAQRYNSRQSAASPHAKQNSST